jgi:phage baseplate assembly protein W
MIGINNLLGKHLSGHMHLEQSIRDILTTPIGSRVMMRDYGSRLPELVDAPLTQSTISDIYAATADALDKWEPRYKLVKISTETLSDGHITLSLSGQYLPDGRDLTIERIVL